MDKQRYKKLIVSVAIAVIAAVYIFQSLYTFNNKYTYDCRQPINGVITIDSREFERTPLLFLIRDWQFYEGILLTPEEIRVYDGYVQYVSIGENSSMNVSLDDNDAYMRGTYRLNMILPETSTFYAMYIPEIYSSYDLYVNNDLILSMGDIYSGQTNIQERIATFSASGPTSVTFLVRDTSGLYGGMVYPPALGAPYAVNTLHSIKIFISCAVFTMILIMLLMSMYLAVNSNSFTTVIFMLLCFAAAGYVCYPLIHMFFSVSGNVSYLFERICTYLVYCFAIILQNRICGVHKRIRYISEITAFAVCLAAAVCSIMISCGIKSAGIPFSVMLRIYKWAAAFYLVMTAVYIPGRSGEDMPVLTASIVFFAMSLAFDRMHPLYEPILGGWFPEIGCCAVITALGYEHWREISQAYNMKLIFLEQRRQIEKQISMQKENYMQLTEHIDESRKLRHDMRQHMRVISELVKSGQYNKLSEYVEEYSGSVAETPPVVLCNNFTLNAIFSYYAGIAAKNAVQLKIKFPASQNILISDTDMSIIFGNLIENALDACVECERDRRIIKITGTADETQLMIAIENPYEGELHKKGDVFMSSKHEGAGIGIGSVREIVERYGGAMDITTNDRTFTVMLNMIF